jgi:hypothetical protein
VSDPAKPADTPPVSLNDFARRHTAKSHFSHYAGTEAQLLALVSQCMGHAKAGSREGVLAIPLPKAGFFSGLIKVSDRMGLAACWTRRAEGEDPYILITAPDAPKSPAAAVEVFLYRRDILGDRATTLSPYEIVSINARLDMVDEPPHPLAMARNMLRRPGGSPAEYTAEELVKAIRYWGQRVHVGTDSVALEGPEYPPLQGEIIKTEKGEFWAGAVCEDWTFLPPPAKTQPPHPSWLMRQFYKTAPGPQPTAAKLAESILYWSQRPRRPQDPVTDL